MNGNAHGTVQFGRDDVIEDVLRDESSDGDPVVQRVGPVDTSGQPVDSHTVHLCRYTRVDHVQRHVVLVRHVRRPLSTKKHTQVPYVRACMRAFVTRRSYSLSSHDITPIITNNHHHTLTNIT